MFFFVSKNTAYHCKIQLVIKTGSKPVKPSGSVNLIKKLELELFKTTFFCYYDINQKLKMSECNLGNI